MTLNEAVKRLLAFYRDAEEHDRLNLDLVAELDVEYAVAQLEKMEALNKIGCSTCKYYDSRCTTNACLTCALLHIGADEIAKPLNYEPA